MNKPLYVVLDDLYVIIDKFVLKIFIKYFLTKF